MRYLIEVLCLVIFTGCGFYSFNYKGGNEREKIAAKIAEKSSNISQFVYKMYDKSIIKKQEDSLILNIFRNTELRKDVFDDFKMFCHNKNGIIEKGKEANLFVCSKDNAPLFSFAYDSKCNELVKNLRARSKYSCYIEVKSE